MLIYGTLSVWSSTCRKDTPALFDAGSRYATAAWVLFLLGPLFLGMCYCLGAGVHILADENNRYAELRAKEVELRTKETLLN